MMYVYVRSGPGGSSKAVADNSATYLPTYHAVCLVPTVTHSTTHPTP